jgi:uncharacterized protein
VGTSANAWQPPTPRQRKAILDRTRTVAMVGASSNPARPSYFVATYLLSSSAAFDVYFVNPRETEILGRPVYPSLAELPVVPDLVDVFRRHEHLPAVLADAIAVGAKTLWLQSGLADEKVARDGEAAGLAVVMDRCLKVDYARMLSAS